MADDDDVRGATGVGDLFAPTGPRRSSFTPAPNDAQSLEAAANVFDDDEIAAALAAELARVASGPINIIRPSAPVADPIAAVSVPPLTPPLSSAAEPTATAAPVSAPPAPTPYAAEPAAPVVSAAPAEPDAPAPQQYAPQPSVQAQYVPEPVVSAPVVPEPAVAEPVVAETAIPEPVATESVVAEPFVAQSFAAQSFVPESFVAAPVDPEPVASQPEPAQAEPAQAEPAQPEPWQAEPAQQQASTDAEPAVQSVPSAWPLDVATPAAPEPAQQLPQTFWIPGDSETEVAPTAAFEPARSPFSPPEPTVSAVPSWDSAPAAFETPQAETPAVEIPAAESPAVEIPAADSSAAVPDAAPADLDGPPDWATPLFGQPAAPPQSGFAQSSPPEATAEPLVSGPAGISPVDPFAPSAPPFAPSNGPFPPPGDSPSAPTESFASRFAPPVTPTSPPLSSGDSDALRALYAAAPAPTVPAADAPPPPGYESPSYESPSSAAPSYEAPSPDDPLRADPATEELGPRRRALADEETAAAAAASVPSAPTYPDAPPPVEEPVAWLPAPSEEPLAAFPAPAEESRPYPLPPVVEPVDWSPAPTGEPLESFAPPSEQPAAWLPAPVEDSPAEPFAPALGEPDAAPTGPPAGASFAPWASAPVEPAPPTDQPAAWLPAPTGEPVSSEPVSSEPVSSEPVSSEPVSSEPVSSEPVSSEPDWREPDWREPNSTHPGPASFAPTSPAPGDASAVYPPLSFEDTVIPAAPQLIDPVVAAAYPNLPFEDTVVPAEPASAEPVAAEPVAIQSSPTDAPLPFFPPPTEEPSTGFAPPPAGPASSFVWPLPDPTAVASEPSPEPSDNFAWPIDDAASYPAPSDEPAAFLPPPAAPTTPPPASDDPFAIFSPPAEEVQQPDEPIAPVANPATPFPGFGPPPDSSTFDFSAPGDPRELTFDPTQVPAPAIADAPVFLEPTPPTPASAPFVAGPVASAPYLVDAPLVDAPGTAEPTAEAVSETTDGVADLWRTASEEPLYPSASPLPPLAPSEPAVNSPAPEPTPSDTSGPTPFSSAEPASAAAAPSVYAMPPAAPPSVSSATVVSATASSASAPQVFDDLLSGADEPYAPPQSAPWVGGSEPSGSAAPDNSPQPRERRPFGDGVESDDAIDPTGSEHGAEIGFGLLATTAVASTPEYIVVDSRPVVVVGGATTEPVATTVAAVIEAPEAIGLEPTAIERRLGRSSRLFWLWFAANSSLAAVVFGTIIFALGVSLRQAIVATLAGVALSFIPLGLGTLAGKRSGQPTMVISRATFGVIGNVVPAIIALFSRLFWAAALLWVIGAGTADLLVGARLTDGFDSGELTIIAMALGFVIAVVIAYFGYRIIAIAQLVVSIISGVTIIGFIALTYQYVNFTTALSKADGPWILVITGAVLVFSFVGLAWANSSADVARYQNPGSSGAVSMLWATFGAALPSFLLIAYGALLAASNSTLAASIAANPFDSLGRLLPVWYPAPLLAATALSLISGVVLSMYSGGFALQAAGLRLQRPLATLLVGVLVLLLAILITSTVTDFTGLFRDFSTTVAVPVAAWAGLFGSEIMIRKRRFDAASLLERGGVYEDVRWPNLAALVAISAIGFGLLSATLPGLTWEGYLFSAFGVSVTGQLAATDLGVLVALVLGIAFPLVAGIPAVRRQESAIRVPE